METATTTPRDADLLAAIGRGDRKALEAVYREVKDDLYSAAFHLLGDAAAAEDVLMDVMVRLAGGARKVRLTKGLRPYLLTMGLNRARDLLRRRKLEPAPVEALDEVRAANPGPAEAAAASDMARAVAAALAEIPEEQREVVVLRFYGRLRFREIGELTGVSINTAQSRYRYALDALRARLCPKGADG